MKISDSDILKAIDNVVFRKQERFERAGFSSYPKVAERAEIQEVAETLAQEEMSKSGFRRRLKQLVDKGKLEEFHPWPYTCWYSKPD